MPSAPLSTVRLPIVPNAFGTPVPDPERFDVPEDHQDLPSVPDPADSSGAPMGGDVPPMRTPAAARQFDPWGDSAYPTGHGVDVIGYRVEAVDGRAGKIDSASPAADSGYLVVDTGPWVFGKKVLISAEAVNSIDPQTHRVYVDRTRDEIRHAPAYDPTDLR